MEVHGLCFGTPHDCLEFAIYISYLSKEKKNMLSISLIYPKKKKAIYISHSPVNKATHFGVSLLSLVPPSVPCAHHVCFCEPFC